MTNSEIFVRAYRGKEQVRARQKMLIKKHVERSKQFEILMSEIDHLASTKQMSIDGISSILSQEMSDILENPFHGL
jgi:hypothetical protein